MHLASSSLSPEWRRETGGGGERQSNEAWEGKTPHVRVEGGIVRTIFIL